MKLASHTDTHGLDTIPFTKKDETYPEYTPTSLHKCVLIPSIPSFINGSVCRKNLVFFMNSFSLGGFYILSHLTRGRIHGWNPGKVLRDSLLAIQSHLCSFALRFSFFKTLKLLQPLTVSRV
jgi:hypothetical protein